MLRKINTDQRPSLSQETLIALMTLECCYESTFIEKLPRKLLPKLTRMTIIDDIKWGWSVGVACVPKAN